MSWCMGMASVLVGSDKRPDCVLGLPLFHPIQGWEGGHTITLWWEKKSIFPVGFPWHHGRMCTPLSVTKDESPDSLLNLLWHYFGSAIETLYCGIVRTEIWALHLAFVKNWPVFFLWYLAKQRLLISKNSCLVRLLLLILDYKKQIFVGIFSLTLTTIYRLLASLAVDLR